MRLIEFVGMVGAGKSVLAERLIAHLRSEGREVLSIGEALQRATSATSGVSTVTGPRIARRLARIVGIVRFVASNRALAGRVIRSQIGLPITARHRLAILRLFFRQMGTIAIIDRYLANDEIVVLDEGPVHRAVNLFSWANRVDLAAARAYLNLLPAGGLVVHVAVPTAVASARTAERGYPKRLDTVDPVAVESFMAGAAAVVDLVAEHLTGGDRSVIMVGNDRALDATLEELTARVDDYLDEQLQPRLRLRSQLALTLVDGDGKLSLEDVVRLKHTPRMLMAERLTDDLIEAVRETGPSGAVTEALEVLEAWDRSAAADSKGGVLFTRWVQRYAETADTAAFYKEPWSAERPMETPRGLGSPAEAADAFAWTAGWFAGRETPADVAWGEIHRVIRGDVDEPVSGCPATYGCFRVLSFEQLPDGRRAANRGDGWVLAVEFGDTPRAYTILAYGQSTKEASPHHADQAAMFARGEMKPIAFTDDDIERTTIRRYRPGTDDQR